MLERIGAPGFESVSKPCEDAIRVLSLIEAKRPVVAEIGVGVGATTAELCRLLKDAELHLFDYSDKLEELSGDLSDQGLLDGINLVLHGNGHQDFNSYAWTLAVSYIEAREKGGEPVQFDFAFLDGAHAFHHDAPACAVLKEMIAPGGFLLFDDMYWTFDSSPTMNPAKNPKMLRRYSQDQLVRPHVEIVVKALMETDARFEQVFLTDNKRPLRSLFRRVA